MDHSAIRQASIADLTLLVDLMREFYAESGYALDEDRATKSFEILLADPRLGAVWIFIDGPSAMGYVVLTVRFSMEYGGMDAFIDDLYVRPANRRRGAARQGLERLFAEGARRGILALHVEVGENNLAAQTLYRSFGMQPYVDGRQMLSVALPGTDADPFLARSPERLPITLPVDESAQDRQSLR